MRTLSFTTLGDFSEVLSLDSDPETSLGADHRLLSVDTLRVNAAGTDGRQPAMLRVSRPTAYSVLRAGFGPRP